MNKSFKEAINVLKKLQAEINILYNENPHKAIEKAVNLKSNSKLPQELVDGFKAAVFVDGGYLTKNYKLVEDGVRIFEELLDKYPDRLDIAYNLANGLSNLTYLSPNQDHFSWIQKTFHLRKKARYLYDRVAKGAKNNELQTQSMTNIGNMFLASNRILEAYDAYIIALKHDSANGIAATGAAKILIHYLNIGIGDSTILSSVSEKYIRIAKKHKDKILKYGGQEALNKLSDLLTMKLSDKPLTETKDLGPYEEFVERNRLSLSPTIEGLDNSILKWDSLIIESIIEPTDKGFGVPPIFAMFNSMKADFLTARWLSYMALEKETPDSGLYYDTLDYANYGMESSLLQLAQRSCLDILDKIAIATTEYLNLPGDVRSISFSNRWYVSTSKNDTQLEWQEAIGLQIRNRNYALMALSELSEDLNLEGILKFKKSLRNASTHRFVILHEMGDSGDRKSKFIEHFNQNMFKDELITTLQVVRSALFYFIELVNMNELQKKRGSDGILMPLTVPSHHSVKGEAD